MMRSARGHASGPGRSYVRCKFARGGRFPGWREASVQYAQIGLSYLVPERSPGRAPLHARGTCGFAATRTRKWCEHSRLCAEESWFGMATTVNKRLKERQRQEKQKDKALKREQRKGARETRVATEPGVDPDLIGIVPGPQPILEDT